MVKITCKEHLLVENLPTKLAKEIKEELTITNPDYEKKLRMGFYLGKTPKKLNIYSTIDDNLILPFGYKDFLLEKLDDYEIIEEHKNNPISIQYNGDIKLYDYQQNAIQTILRTNNGILISPCGSGKTTMALHLIKELQCRTLWITHTLDLLKQSYNVCKTLYDNKLGKISEGKIDVQDITFATVQTLANADLNLLKDMFELVIVDECFSGDTEILTNKGFKRFDQLDKNEVVAQYNNGKVDFIKPTRYISKEVDEYVSFKHKNVEIKTTKNHNMVYLDYATKKEKVRPAIDFVNHTLSGHAFITEAEVNQDTSQILSDMDRIKIMLQADGCLYHSGLNEDTYKLEFSKERKIKRFKTLCDNAGIKYKEYKKRVFDNVKWNDSYKFTIKMEKNKNKYKYLTDFLDQPKNKQYALDILEEIAEWDGHIRDYNIEYDTSIKENADFVKLCSFLGGVKSSQVMKIENNNRVIYRIYYNENVNINYERFNKTLIKEKLKTYCVEVPTHKIVVRKDGFIFVSGNCHKSSGTPSKLKMFYKAISSLNARYKYGLTATLFGGKSSIQYTPIYLIGKVLHEIKSEDIKRVNATHEIVRLYTPKSDLYLKTDKTLNYMELINYLVYNQQRNIDIVEELLKYKNDYNLILSGRNAHLELIKELLDTYGVSTLLLTGNEKKDQREFVLNEFRNGNCKYLLSNYPLAKEGLDLPIANILHLIFPIKDKATLIQSKGRVERLYKNKTYAKVIDYVDVNIGYLLNMYTKRKGALK